MRPRIELKKQIHEPSAFEQYYKAATQALNAPKIQVNQPQQLPLPPPIPLQQLPAPQTPKKQSPKKGAPKTAPVKVRIGQKQFEVPPEAAELAKVAEAEAKKLEDELSKKTQEDKEKMIAKAVEKQLKMGRLKDELSIPRYKMDFMFKILKDETNFNKSTSQNAVTWEQLWKLVQQFKPTTFENDYKKAYEYTKAHPELIMQYGSGKNASKGLYGDEIEQMMERARPIFKGVVASDEIATLPATKHQKLAFIMNLDKSNQPGSHWIGVYIDPVDEKTIEYYDSFGRPCPPELLDQFKQLIDKLDINYYLKFKENRVIDQRSNSNECGFFAAKFILDRLRGKPFKDCTGYSNVTEAEKRIKNFKHDFGYL